MRRKSNNQDPTSNIQRGSKLQNPSLRLGDVLGSQLSDINHGSTTIAVRIRRAAIPLDTHPRVARAGERIQNHSDDTDNKRPPKSRPETIHIKMRSKHVTHEVEEERIDD